MPKLALIRGFGGEPLCRIIAGFGNGVVYVTSQMQKTTENQWFPPPIGVPLADAFAYSDTAFERLRRKWKAGKSVPAKDWGEPLKMKEAAN